MFESLKLNGYTIYPNSVSQKWDKIYFLAKKKNKKYLISDDEKFESRVEKISCYNIYKKTHANALKLRKLFAYLNPKPCGLKKSFSFGDRLGIATPGHIQALGNHDIFPIFAQQSIRELDRTNRTIESVINDAMWGVFEKGYKKGYGADIDHVKNQKDILEAIDCGFTMFTIDSSDIKRITKLYNLINERISSPFDFEISIDETDAATTFQTHRFIVEELRRNGVEFTGLALKFVGEFEKGIDYIGNIEAFKKNFLEHLAICKHYGGYKLSIHSGSDKFSIYPIIGKNAEAFHVKTSGTSWLEAIRLIRHKDPQFFHKMHQIAIDNFKESCQNYKITAKLYDISDRQLFHISYGILLKNLKDKIYNILNIYEEEHYKMLENHLNKHLKALLS